MKIAHNKTVCQFSCFKNQVCCRCTQINKKWGLVRIRISLVIITLTVDVLGIDCRCTFKKADLDFSKIVSAAFCPHKIPLRYNVVRHFFLKTYLTNLVCMFYF